ncbi:MAG: UvrD-helicase domain-containing protein [Blastocatellia bacterium]|nr:UvrD-helicase domain-containing protein [Blastocatellia bacterium]
MRLLKVARERARLLRHKIGLEKEGLLERVKSYIENDLDIELFATTPPNLRHGHALYKSAEKCLYYDQKYDADPAKLLEVLLHELGHLECHPRLTRICTTPDPLLGSMYSMEGTGAVARYSPRMREEAEANAFVTEFLCPQEEVFRLWKENPDNDSTVLAKHFGISLHLVHTQLAESLYWLSRSEKGAPIPSRRDTISYHNSQLDAATFIGAPTLVSAGPGTGKTATLIKRIEYLLHERKADPARLLVLTFSNEAAQELEDRIANRFGHDIAAQVTINTFHGFGISFLHNWGQLINLSHEALILDEAGQQELVSHLLGQVPCELLLDLKQPDETARKIVAHINHLKNRLHTPDSLQAELTLWEMPDENREKKAACQFLAIFRAYEQENLARQRVDFADLIALPVTILKNNSNLISRSRQKYQWVMVDEYQDVSRSVAQLLQLLCGPDNPPWVVGDSRQAIYRFLGAAPENVDGFEQDFPGAVRFDLSVNYRSCAEIITAANQLGHLMEQPETDSTDYPKRWEADVLNPVSFSALPIHLLVGNSDQAEQEAVARQIWNWIEQGASPGEIAVLARRNVDVRNVVLALGKKGIKAVTSGLATLDGAAGDLAVIVTFADRPRTSLPRVLKALNPKLDKATINEHITHLQYVFADDEYLKEQEAFDDPLENEILRIWKVLRKQWGDGFTTICSFLFDGSAYLRRILQQPESAERFLQLGEIVTALARAATWRFTHQNVLAKQSRRGFAQLFRQSLTAATPSAVPAPNTTDAVRVMTCHASKGLEFPLVAVVGQTLPDASRVEKLLWIPPVLQPTPESELRQADSLLFVGITRAKGAVTVSYSTTTGGRSGSPQHARVPLLERWYKVHALPSEDVYAEADEAEEISTSDIWGGAPNGSLSASTLDKDSCAIKTYLNDFLDLRFPLNDRPLYPVFYQTTRLTLERAVQEALTRNVHLDTAAAKTFLRKHWEEKNFNDHSHLQLYIQIGECYIERLARIVTMLPPLAELLDYSAGNQEGDVQLRYNLIAFYRATTGAMLAVTFHPESFAKDAKEGKLLWSKVKAAHRSHLLMLKRIAPQLQPFIFSGEDGALYEFQWSTKRGSVEGALEQATNRLRQFANRQFNHRLNDWKCNRCEMRLICPHWLEVI